jgi:hypothetical protein
MTGIDVPKKVTIIGSFSSFYIYFAGIWSETFLFGPAMALFAFYSKEHAITSN